LKVVGRTAARISNVGNVGNPGNEELLRPERDRRINLRGAVGRREDR
jgi:hypothetical protein